jgi:hypothetical protein
LTGADLSGADLSGADLSGADLTGADLAGTELYRTCWDSSTIWPHGYVLPPLKKWAVACDAPPHTVGDPIKQDPLRLLRPSPY